METNNLRIGIDAGSTTIKFVVLNAADEIVYKSYRRHKADVRQMFREELSAVGSQFSDATFSVAVTGSAGMGIVETGATDAFLEIQPEFEHDLMKLGIARVMISVNSVNATKGAICSQYLTSIVRDYSQDLLAEKGIEMTNLLRQFYALYGFAVFFVGWAVVSYRKKGLERRAMKILI